MIYSEESLYIGSMQGVSEGSDAARPSPWHALRRMFLTLEKCNKIKHLGTHRESVVLFSL